MKSTIFALAIALCAFGCDDDDNDNGTNDSGAGNSAGSGNSAGAGNEGGGNSGGSGNEGGGNSGGSGNEGGGNASGSGGDSGSGGSGNAGSGGDGGSGGDSGSGGSGNAGSGGSVVDTCGDGECDADESYATCPADCLCGDGICGEGENTTNCADDCFCGNGRCDEGETPTSCDQDCFCVINGDCDPATAEHPAETYISCPDDCTCGNGICDAQKGETMTCKADCQLPPLDSIDTEPPIGESCNADQGQSDCGTAACCGKDYACGDDTKCHYTLQPTVYMLSKVSASKPTNAAGLINGAFTNALGGDDFHLLVEPFGYDNMQYVFNVGNGSGTNTYAFNHDLPINNFKGTWRNNGAENAPIWNLAERAPWTIRVPGGHVNTSSGRKICWIEFTTHVDLAFWSDVNEGGAILAGTAEGFLKKSDAEQIKFSLSGTEMSLMDFLVNDVMVDSDGDGTADAYEIALQFEAAPVKFEDTNTARDSEVDFQNPEECNADGK